MIYSFYARREMALHTASLTGLTPCIVQDKADHRQKMYAVIDESKATIGNFWTGWVGMAGCYQFFPIRPTA